VRDNIANFGGDPGTVMIFGQSGGGRKVSTLLGMPAAKGLFHRAAVHSGSALRQLEPEYSAKLAAGLLTELGLSAAQADRLQEAPMDRLQEAQVQTLRKVQLPPAATAGGATAWGPTVDGKVLPAHPFEPSATTVSANVPLIVGTVLNEQVNALFRPELAGMTEADMQQRLAQSFGANSARVIDAFRRGNPKASPFELFSRIAAVSSYRQNAVTMATRKAALGAAPAYNYWFTWHTPLFDGTTGVFHCAELPFAFYNTDLCATQTGGTAEARALSAKMADAWVNFARTGDPNHAGLPKWPVFNASQAPVMIFDDRCEVKNNPDGEQRQAILDAGGGQTRIRA
jgi:para-nitrobenzyl esterase